MSHMTHVTKQQEHVAQKHIQHGTPSTSKGLRTIYPQRNITETHDNTHRRQKAWRNLECLWRHATMFGMSTLFCSISTAAAQMWCCTMKNNNEPCKSASPESAQVFQRYCQWMVWLLELCCSCCTPFWWFLVASTDLLRRPTKSCCTMKCDNHPCKTASDQSPQVFQRQHEWLSVLLGPSAVMKGQKQQKGGGSNVNGWTSCWAQHVSWCHQTCCTAVCLKINLCRAWEPTDENCRIDCAVLCTSWTCSKQQHQQSSLLVQCWRNCKRELDMRTPLQTPSGLHQSCAENEDRNEDDTGQLPPTLK